MVMWVAFVPDHRRLIPLHISMLRIDRNLIDGVVGWVLDAFHPDIHDAISFRDTAGYRDVDALGITGAWRAYQFEVHARVTTDAFCRTDAVAELTFVDDSIAT